MADKIIAEVGSDQPVVVIEKLYGPLIFANLRITARYATCEWVIERQRIDSGEWEFVAAITGQHDYEFDEAHPDHRPVAE